jgi:hypothetical protein
MTWISDVIMLCLFGVLSLLLLGGLGMAAYASWELLPATGRTALKRALLRITGRQGSMRQGEPIYTVHIDGSLRYASGQEDVQAFLLAAMTVASRQVLRTMTDAQAATLVFSCGNQSVVLEVHRA